MKRLAERIVKITTDHTEAGHPIQINYTLQPEYLKAAELTQEMHLDERTPKLFTLVTASAFDGAVHIPYVFGKAHHLNCYLTYGPEFMSYDLGHYLAPQFRGEYPSRYLSARAPAVDMVQRFHWRVRRD